MYWYHCDHSGPTYVLPNFELTCPAQTLQFGVVVTGDTSSDCAPRTRYWSAWAFQAEAGERFEVTSFGGDAVGIADRRGVPDARSAGERSQQLTAPAAGTYYVVVYNGTPYSFRLDRK